MSPNESLTDIQSYFFHAESNSGASEESRKKALDAARSLCHQLEKPMESMLRIAWVEPAYAACLKIGVDIDLYSKLDDLGKSAEELASLTNTDPVLLTRILRLLVQMETIQQVGGYKFYATRLSNALCERPVSAAVDHRYRTSNPAFHGLPSYLKNTNYVNPSDLHNGPWQYGVGTKLSFFEYLSANPDALEIMTRHMEGYTMQRSTWEDVYPIQERLIGEDTRIEDMNDIILADLGGGAGHDLKRFATSFVPTLKKPLLVLQDLPDVLDQAKSLPPTIKAIPVDLTRHSPVPGARGYYMHSVLHDWPDEDVRTILKQMHPVLSRKTADGRTPKLLLNENVLLKQGLQLQAAALDLIMLAVFASHERSEEQWSTLLESAGYRITGIFTKPGIDESVIEAEAVGSVNGS